MSDFVREFLFPLTKILAAELKCDYQTAVKYVISGVSTICKPEITREQKEIQEEGKEKRKKKEVFQAEEVKESKVCEYVFVRSPKKGQKCSSYIDKKSEHFCSKHIKKSDDKEDNKAEKKVAKKPVEKIKTEKTKAVSMLSDVLKNFVDNKKSCILKVERNQFGNYQCVEKELDRLLVDPVTLEIYGVQEDNGKMTELTRHNVETCKNRGLMYRIPLNLSSTKDEEKPINDYDNKEDDMDDDDNEYYAESDDTDID